MDDFHADAVAAEAAEARARGDKRKAVVLFRSILEFHPVSRAASAALDYLATNRVEESAEFGSDGALGTSIWPARQTRKAPQRVTQPS